MRTVIHHDLACSIQHYPINLGADKRGLCPFPNCNSQTVWYCDTCDIRLCHGQTKTVLVGIMYNTNFFTNKIVFS